MIAAFVGQSVLSASHSHALNSHDAHDVDAHQHGECGHAPGQSHSDPHADECAICAAVLLKSSRPEPLLELSDIFVLSICKERPADVQHDNSHEIHIASIRPRAPPMA